jgi:hypothetical protein
MSFFHPAALLWGLLAIAVALFYLRRPGRRRQPVSSLGLWQQALARRPAWARWQRAVSLAIQLAIVALLVVALAEPYWRSSFEQSRHIVLIVDNSASMNATDVNPTRLAAAREQARQLIDGLGLYEHMSIVSAGGSLRVHCGFTGDRRKLSQSLDAIVPTDASSRVEEAAKLARRVLAGRRNPQIVVLTDGCFDSAAELSKQTHVQIVLHGTPADNIGITRLAVRSGAVDPSRSWALVELMNFGAQPVQCELETVWQDKPVDKTPLNLPAGARVQHLIPLNAETEGLLIAKLDRADTLLADNQARTLISPQRRIRVALAPNADEAIDASLAAMPFVELLADSPNVPPDVTILLGDIPPQLPAGNFFIVAPTSSCDLWELTGTVKDGLVVSEQDDTPLLAHVDLSAVVFDEAVRLNFTQPARTLAASAAGDPIYSLIDRPNGTVLVLHTPLDKSDLPKRAALPVFLGNAVRWLGGVGDSLHPAITTDDLVAIDSAADARALRDPHGRTQPLLANVKPLVQPDLAGVWAVLPELAASDTNSATENSQLVVTSNLANPRESNLKPVAGIQSADIRNLIPGRGHPLWIYFAGAALLLLIADWTLFQRGSLV